MRTGLSYILQRQGQERGEACLKKWKPPIASITHTRENAFYLFSFHILSQAKNTGPKDQVCWHSNSYCSRHFSDTLSSNSALWYTQFLFDKCNHFHNRAIQNHFIYSKALLRASQLYCFKDLSSGDSPSAVEAGQSNSSRLTPSCLQFSREPSTSQTQKHPFKSWGIWNRNGTRVKQKWRLPTVNNLWSN